MEENPNQDPSVTAAADADATSTTTTNLNDLSQDILLHILSFLPTLESITTSLISKKWKSLWLEFIYEDRYGCHVDSWVRYAIRNRVSELDLDFFIDESFHIVESEGRRDYDFPFSALRNGKVRVLKLCRCDLTLPADMESMNLWSMKEIFFDQIYMTDDMVLNLLKACPNIEVLKLENCYGMENLRLCSEKLKRLGLSSFYTAERELYLELDCPNLIWLSIDCVETGEFCIKNLSSLIEFRTSIMHKTEHYGHWFKVVKQLHRIAHIKHLVVQNWWRKESLSEELLNKPIHFSIPSLKEVKLKVIPGENQNQIVQFVALLKKQGVVLDKIVLVPLYSGISVSRRRPLRAEVNE
ncbi:hypothetical protein DKX38_029891 [Salix brachista]|uniref:F-box domain-containing protein n=1 Tax=Salix brachista TaxID=2182728 RepID=A0A5N5J5X3_9ROSI|nr:hypothetical protein DKX38_029891 [Salix brachista]